MPKESEEWESKGPVIVGAGTIGAYFADKISELNPVLLEEHRRIGRPVHCTGLISKRILDLTDIPKDTILNSIKGARIYSPSGNFCEIGNDETRAFVFDRQKLDEHLSKGLNISNEKYISHSVSGGFANIKTSKRRIKTKLMADCSGAGSKIFNGGKNLVGIQYRMKMKHDPDFVELHFGNKICPGFFAWVVPEDEETCRVGLAAENPSVYMNRFCRKLKGKIIEKQAGLIPMETKRFYSNNLIAIGDSAGQTKKTTGGGVITGFLSADIASDAVKRAYEVDNFSSEFFFVNYRTAWTSGVGKQISMHDRIRRAFNRMSDEELNSFIKFLNNNIDAINEHGDMDFPINLLLKLMKPGNLGTLLGIFLKSI